MSEADKAHELLRQLVQSGPSSSTPQVKRNGLHHHKRKSRSPSRLSSTEPGPSREGSEPLNSPTHKRRRMQSRSRTSTPARNEQGRGKNPTRSQKGIPSTDEETSKIALANEKADDDDGKPVREVKQGDKEVDRVVKGVSLDTERTEDGETKVNDDLDEVSVCG